MRAVRRYVIDPTTAAGVAGRAKVDQLIPTDLAEALREARTNPHPWYRCQSLTSIAAATKDDARAASILLEALRSAKEQDEPNRIVTVAAWPLSVAAKRGLLDVPAIVAEMLQIIAPEPNPIRRADALLKLLEAVMQDRALRMIVLTPLLDACAESRGWKGRRILQYTALAVGNHQKLAREIIERIPESREKRRAQNMLHQRR